MPVTVAVYQVQCPAAQRRNRIEWVRRVGTIERRTAAYNVVRDAEGFTTLVRDENILEQWQAGR